MDRSASLESVASGIADMDREHAALCAGMHMLEDAIVDGDHPAAMAALTAYLHALRQDYVCEEALMVRWRYPDTAAHLHEHALLELSISALARRLRDDREPPRVLLDELAAISRAITCHMETADAAFARYMRQQSAS